MILLLLFCRSLGQLYINVDHRCQARVLNLLRGIWTTHVRMRVSTIRKKCPGGGQTARLVIVDLGCDIVLYRETEFPSLISFFLFYLKINNYHSFIAVIQRKVMVSFFFARYLLHYLCMTYSR